MAPKRILIIRLSALGDVAMTLPAIYSLARQNPTLEVTVLTSEKFCKLFLECPENLRLVPYSKERHGGFKGWLRLLGELRRYRFQQVADMHNVMRSWLIDAFFLIQGVRVAMVPKRRKERRRILMDKQSAEPFIQRYFKVLQRLGHEVKPDFPGFFFESPQIADGPLSARKRIGIAPFARYMNKTYPIEQMRQVVRLLDDSGQFDIYLFGGGKRETDIFTAWRAESKHIAYASGSLSLGEELALMHGLDAMVSMDSANMHLAALTGVRVISIWGSTTPACGFLGWQQRTDDALYADVPCQPCTISGSPVCQRGDLLCFLHITPEQIVEKICQIVK